MLYGLRFGLVGLKHIGWLEVWFGRVKACCMAWGLVW